jgi:hypothetical protein
MKQINWNKLLIKDLYLQPDKENCLITKNFNRCLLQSRPLLNNKDHH